MTRLLQPLMCFLALMFSSVAIAETRLETIISNGHPVVGVTEQVEIVRSRARIDALPGLELEEGDVLKTDANTQVVIVRNPGAIEIYVRENTEVQISSIWLTLGEIYVRVKEALRERFEVKSEYGVAGVEGTEFILRVANIEESESEFTCLTIEGSVSLVSKDNRWDPETVEAGFEFTWSPLDESRLQAVPQEKINSARSSYAPYVEIHRDQTRDISVPVVIGLFESDASQLLINERLVVGNVTRVLTGAQVGAVVSQEPAPGESISPYGSVSLEIEGTPTTMPELVGLTEAKARTALNEAKLVIEEITYVAGEKEAEGIVVDQSFPPGSTLLEGAVVQISVIQGGQVRPNPPSLLQ